jgi:hypothetical protein
LGDLLKRLYSSDEITQLVNLTHPALEECASEGSAQLGGSNFYFPVRTESAHGHAYIAESQDLPAGRETTVKQAVVAPTVHAGVVQLTGLSMAVSSGNAMAFARAFDENVSQTIQAMTAYKEGALFRDGSGLLTQFNGAVATTGAFTVDDPAFLREGMVVDLIDSTATTRHNTNVKVQAVNWANKTVEFATAIAAAVDDNDRIYLADSQNDTGALQTVEPFGFESSIRASNTYLGLDRTAAGNANWAAQEISASSFLDESLLLRGRTRITQESGVDISGMAGTFKFVCHPMQADTLFKLAIPRIRFTPGGSDFDLGNSGNPSFGDIRLVTSYQCPPSKGYLGDFQYHQSLHTPNGQLHIDTEYNGASLKWVATKDVGLVFIKEYCQFVNKKPVCFLRYDSLTEQTR